jgi:thiamine-phosphate pyrophosphorylase
VEARKARALGADYIGLGPIFATSTKATSLPVLGPSGVGKIANKGVIPIIAIGGIHAGNAEAVIRAGADAVAVVSAILGARDVRKAAWDLREAVASHFSKNQRIFSIDALLKKIHAIL